MFFQKFQTLLSVKAIFVIHLIEKTVEKAFYAMM